MNSERWQEVNKSNPCPACGKPDWCAWTPDRAMLKCERTAEPPAGMVKMKDADGGALFKHADASGPRTPTTTKARQARGADAPCAAPTAAPDRDWQAAIEVFRTAMAVPHLTRLAEATGIPATAWARLSPGWAGADDLYRLHAGGAGWKEDRPNGAWAVAEHSGDGRVVGISLRAADGRKGAPSGAHRGLVVPANLHQLPDPVLVVEGASDVAACCAMGLAAVGRPSNVAGAEDAATMLEGRSTLVVGERDGKPGGAWPGRDGARAVARQLASRWGERVRWTLPPLDTKDVRAFLCAKLAGGLDAADPAAMQAAGGELLAALEAAAREVKPERRSQADSLVDLARAEYRLGVSSEGEAFAVPLAGPTVAIMFRGGGSGLRAALAKAYRRRIGKTPSASALADAMVALEGMAQDAAPEPVALRVAALDEGIVLDLADPTGRVVVVKPAGWAVEAVSPVLFRRTALTAPLPEPEQAKPEDLAQLRGLLNVDDETWPLVVGWTVAAVLPAVPHPVLLLGGEQGTGKSSAARLILGLVDPSSALLRSEPRDAEQWAIAAAGSWAVCIDNVSRLGGWFSDAICKAVTGDGLVRRKLYTDSDLAVLSFKRCIVLTSIDHGALRGDLGDRLLLVDLERIGDDRRRTEAELGTAYNSVRPRMLGALLAAVSRVLAALPGVKLAKMPRMADFARVLAALDKACPELTGGMALALFEGQRQRIADEVVDGDAVAVAVVKLMEGREVWNGTAGELLAALSPEYKPRNWPANARALSGRLRRLRPALLAVGIQYDPPAKADKTRTHHMEKAGSRPPEPPNGDDSRATNGLRAGGTGDAVAIPPNDRPAEKESSEAISASLGGMGGQSPALSGDVGNVCASWLAAGLDPDRPGPTDLLSQDQYRRYRSVYEAHKGEPGEKHAAAWHAAVSVGKV